jgi:type IV secretory pathway VirD2 relaxase
LAKTNDERLWKLIVSPEFGDRVDLKRLTRDLISQMETDLGTRLEWVAAAISIPSTRMFMLRCEA